MVSSIVKNQPLMGVYWNSLKILIAFIFYSTSAYPNYIDNLLINCKFLILYGFHF